MTREMLADLKSKLTSEEELNFQCDCLLQGVRSKIYQPLMQRTTCGLYDKRFSFLDARKLKE